MGLCQEGLSLWSDLSVIINLLKPHDFGFDPSSYIRPPRCSISGLAGFILLEVSLTCKNLFVCF
jgi:hypothetical protein